MLDLFSSEFAVGIWGKRAAELVTDFNICESSIYNALLAYHRRPSVIRSINRHSEAVTAIDGVRTSSVCSDLLLSGSDDSLDDYISRVDRLMVNNEWSVAYFGLHAANPLVWEVAKGFSDRLAYTLGYRPGGRVDIDCFVGRYSSTHTGVHVDHAHNFAFTLRNGKTMFAWPGDRAELQGLKSPDYDIYKDTAIALENMSDRVAYFPQDYFHVAESKDCVSVNVNITFWEASDDLRSTVDYLHTLLRTPLRTRRDVHASGLVTLDADNEFLLLTLRSLLKDRTIQRRMAVAQLILDTSSRLGVGRPLVEVSEIDDLVALNTVSTLQWMVLEGLEQILVAANGHVAAFPYSRDLDQFLARLAESETIDIAWLSNGGKSESDKQLYRVLVALARWGAI